MAYYKSAHCVIEGAVEIGADASIWHYAVVRGDEDRITIGARTNVQDGAVLHVDEGWPLSIGSGVTIGHRAVVHGCTIEDDVLVGMGAIIQEGAVIEENCFIGAGAIVKRGMRIPKGHMAYGIPCRIVRPITQAEYDEIRISTQEYQEYKAEYERREQENDSLL